MALGDITALDTLKWSDGSDSQVAVEVRDGIITVIFEDYVGAAYTPKCTTFSYDGDGNLTKIDEQTLTGLPGDCAIVFSAVKITDGILAFTYIESGSPYAGVVATVSIGADGSITTAVVDYLQFDDDTYESKIVHAIGDYWLITFTEEGGDTPYAITVEIDSSGNVGAALTDSQQLNAGGSCTGQSAVKVADGVVVLFYSSRDGASINNYVETRSVAADGSIGSVIDGPDTWGTTGNYDMQAAHLGGTIYACSYREGVTSDGWFTTFNIATDGTITAGDVDEFEYETTRVRRWGAIAGSNEIACVFHPDNDDTGQFRTVDVDDSGNIGATLKATESVDATFSDYTYIVRVSTTMYIVVWTDDDGYGQAASLSVVIGVAPTVTTQAVSDIAGTTATGNGNITALGSPNPTAHGVCWNTSGTPTTADDKTDEGAAAATGAFTTAMPNLIPGTTYSVRAYAINAAGTSYGEEVTFMAGVAPTVTQEKPSNIQATVATGHGNITDLGSPSPTQHGHCWNRTGTPTTSDSKTENGAASATGGFTSAMTSLTSGRRYYVRAYATNAKGTSYSSTTWSFIAGGGGEHKALSG